MIISDRYGFLFIANLRTASTSLHQALGPYASVNLDATSGGKHSTLADIYRWLGSARVAPLFKWAVIREPTQYLASVYQYHKRPAFDGKPHSTKGTTFAEFYNSESHAWMRVPQTFRFLDPDGAFGLDFLMSMDRLHEGFSYLKFRLGLPNVLLPRLNSNRSRDVDLVAEGFEDRIRADYASDYAVLDRYADKERTLQGFVPIFESGELLSSNAEPHGG